MAMSLRACAQSLNQPSVSSSQFLSCSPPISNAKWQFGTLYHCSASSVFDLQSQFLCNLQSCRRGVGPKPSVSKHRSSTVCAAIPGLAPGTGDTKIAPLTIRDAKIVAEPPQDNTLNIRVDIDGQASKRAFDTVLKDLARHAPPVPGFRKAKGGKTSIVPLNLIYQLMGPTLVRKFVIEEIIKATLLEYTGKEGIKAKNELKTDQSSDELDAIFEPGKPFGFNATLNLEDEQTQVAETTETPTLDEEAAVQQVSEATA